MSLKAILLIILLVVVSVFLVQNASPVVVSFLFWKFEASVAVVVFLSVLTGVVIAGIIFSSAYIRRFLR